MALLDKYQSKVGIEQGAIRDFCKAGGFFNAGHNSDTDQGIDFTGRQMMNMMATWVTKTNINNSAGVLSVITMPRYGYVFYSCTTAASQASANFPSAEAGAGLVLIFKGVQSNLSLLKGNAVSIEGIRGSDLSAVNIINGSVQSAYIELICFKDGVWSVAFYANAVGVVELPST